MARNSGTAKDETAKKKRKGIHSKNNHSNSKQSKNYKKKYKGQGR